MHKGFKCLDVSEGRIYISRDVVFDENLFPFAELHSNAGIRFRLEVLLLPMLGGMSSETNEFEAPSSLPNPACVDAEENSVLRHEIPPQRAPAPPDPTGANSEEDTGLSSLQTALASSSGSVPNSSGTAAQATGIQATRRSLAAPASAAAEPRGDNANDVASTSAPGGLLCQPQRLRRIPYLVRLMLLPQLDPLRLVMNLLLLRRLLMDLLHLSRLQHQIHLVGQDCSMAFESPKHTLTG
jgi:hypothetical protein